MNDLYPCKCGHSKQWHKSLQYFDVNDQPCSTLWSYINDNIVDVACPCDKFEADNLKYLEELSR